MGVSTLTDVLDRPDTLVAAPLQQTMAIMPAKYDGRHTREGLTQLPLTGINVPNGHVHSE